jgi:choline-sulfatase
MVDIGPTLAELGGAAPMPLASGRSLVPLLRGETIQWPNEAFSEFPPSSGTPAIRMIRSGKWKLIHYDGMASQLFDLESDPQEMKDLAESPQHRELCRRLQTRAIEGWSAEEIKREQAQRARSQPLLRQWAQQVHPDAPQQWIAPDNVNVYTLPH